MRCPWNHGPVNRRSRIAYDSRYVSFFAAYFLSSTLMGKLVGYSIFNTTAAAFDRLGPTQSEIGLTAPPKCLFQFTSPNQLHPTIQTGNTVETPVVGKPSALPDVAMSGYVPGAREPNRLPPARKGGRRGPLTEEQARHQKDARLRGICIRCRRTRIKVRRL